MHTSLHEDGTIPPEWWGDFVPIPERDEASEIALNLRGGAATRELVDRARERLSNVARVQGTTVAQILRSVGWNGSKPVRVVYITDALDATSDIRTEKIGGAA